MVTTSDLDRARKKPISSFLPKVGNWNGPITAEIQNGYRAKLTATNTFHELVGGSPELPGDSRASDKNG